MNFDEKFDKIIRQKVKDAEFPFDENNWQKASKMIDAERMASGGAKTGKMFLLFGALFLGVATLTFFILTFNNQSKSESVLAVKDQPQTSDNLNDNNSQVTVAPVIAKEMNDAKPALESNKQINTSIDKNINNETKIVSETSHENSSAPSAETIETKKSNNSIVNVNIVEKTDHENSGKSDDRKNQDELTESNTDYLIESRSKKKNTLRPVLGSQQNKEASVTVFDKKNDSNSDSNSLSRSESDENSNSHTNYSHMDMQANFLQVWTSDPVLQGTTYDFIRIYDEDYFKAKRRKIHFLNAEIGTTYLFGWDTKNGRDASGFNAFAGMNYGIYTSRKTSLSVGAQIYNVSNIDQPFYSKVTYDYDFGYNGNFTNITTNSLHYFSIPIKFYYNVSKFGKAGLGLNTGFLFNGRNTLETYTLQDNEKLNLSETEVKGYYSGVNTKNILVSAFYNHRFNKRFSLNTEIIYGLSDVYSNSVTKTQTKEKNMGIRLSLQYTIFDK